MPRRPGTAFLGRTAAIYGAAAAGGFAAGVVSASSRIGLIGLFAGLVAAAALALSRSALLWFIVIGGLVVTGLLQLYVPEVRYFRFLLPVAAFALFLHGVLGLLESPGERRLGGDGIVLLMCAFILVAASSMAINWDAGLAAQGLKDYFVLWIFFFALALCRWRPGEMDRLPGLVLAIAFLQLPFALHQFFVLIPLREALGDPRIVPADIVVGTFGGSVYGGGANAVLSLFVLIVAACLLGLWKRGALSSTKTACLALPIVVPTFINEAKVAVIYLPVVFIVLFYRDIVRRPLRFMFMGGVAVVLFSVLMAAMIAMHPSGELRKWSDLVRLTYEQQTAGVAEAERRGEYSALTRWTSLTFWAQEHVGEHPVHIAIGHGPGASRVLEQEDGIRLAQTLADTKYGGLRLGTTAVSALLWDTGVLGLATVLAVLFAAYRTAGRLAAAHAASDPFRAGIFDGLRAAICLIAISLAHKDFFVMNVPYQTLLLLILGYLVVSRYEIERRTHDHDRK